MKHSRGALKLLTFAVVLALASVHMNAPAAAAESHGVKAKHDHDHEKSSEGEDSHGHEEHENENDGEHGEHGEHGDHEEEEVGSGVGPGKAVTEATKRDGVKLSEAAIKSLELQYMEVGQKAPYRVPASAIVQSKEERGVYRLRNGWFKLIDIRIVSKGDLAALIQTSELKSGDQIVVQGVPLLRVAELEAWGGSGDGHGH